MYAPAPAGASILRRCRGAVAVTATAALLVGLTPAPASAQTTQVSTVESERVLGGVTLQKLRINLPDGAIARGDLLRFRETQSGIELRPRLARGTIAGVEAFSTMARGEYPRGAIAGINGGYWLNRPSATPNGLHVHNGTLSGGQAVNSNGRPTGRGMVGIHADGRLVMDRLTVGLQLDLPDLPGSVARPIDEIDRATGTANIRPNGELLLFDDRYGTAFAVPAGSVAVVVQGLRVRSSGRSEGRVASISRPTSATSMSVPANSHVLLAHGVRAPDLAGLAVDHRVGVTTTIQPELAPGTSWNALRGGIAGGQMMMSGGSFRDANEWGSFAAFGDDGRHCCTRQPRTAIGRTAGGEALLLTVDGRRAGWSVGATVAETAAILYRLGAVDAVNLDGGGSTTMTTGGAIRNRPSEVGRSVATGLFVYAPPPPPARSLDRACPPGQVPRSGFGDTAGTTHAASIDCLRWWGVTSGLTPTRFQPGGNVSRGQMATFLAKWIDDVAARGSGRALGSDTSHPFTDVPTGHTHGASIARLHRAGVISGTSRTTYAPNDPVTRAQTASLVRGAVEYVTGSQLAAGRDTFIDDNTSPHEPSIDRLSNVGVISGTRAFEFTPGAPVSRGAMASLVMRASDLLVEQGRVSPPR